MICGNMPGLNWSWWTPPCGERAERADRSSGLWRSWRLRRSIPQGFRFADTPIQVLDGFRRDFQPLAFPAVGPHGLPSHHLPGKVESQQMPERFGFGSMIPIEVTVRIDARPDVYKRQMLAQAERFLTEILGPVAKVLVRRTALQVSSPAELVQRLRASVPNEPDRLLFERRMRGVLGGTIGGAKTMGSTSAASQMSASLGSFDQATLETARRD